VLAVDRRGRAQSIALTFPAFGLRKKLRGLVPVVLTQIRQ
jgi:hypothetical protein